MALPTLLRPWTHRNYAYYIGGMTPNLITLWMQRVGLGWLAWELTESTTWLGVIAAADLAPMLLLAPFAGVAVDRGNPLRIQRIATALEVLQALALGVFTLLGWMSIELLLVLSLMLGCIHPYATASRHAIVPSLVPRDIYPTAVATDSALFNASRFVGPALAGLIIPFAGAGGTFMVNAVGCAIFLWGLFQVDLVPPKRDAKRRSVLGDVSSSLVYIRGHVGIAVLFVAITAMSTFARPIQDMLPGFAGDVFKEGAVGLAWLTSSMGIGAMASAIFIAARGRITGLTTGMMLGCLGLALSLAGFVATDDLYVASAFCALVGFTMNSISTSAQALVQFTVADDMRGRVMSFYALVYRGTPAIGAVLVGVLSEHLSLRWSFAAVAVICLLIWLLLLNKRRAMTSALES
ncbi:MAG: MFS transporter [Alphaproteobacteria bacterium]